MHINFVVIYTTDMKLLNYFAFFDFDFKVIKGFSLPSVAFDFPRFDSLCKACAARKLMFIR